LLLEIGGVAHLFGGETALAEKIVHDMAARRHRVRAALADTIGAAWAVSHFGGQAAMPPRPTGGGSGFRRPPASRRQVDRRPRSLLLIVPPGESLGALRPLPIESLRFPEEMTALLHQLGIRWIKQLEAIPRREFLSRFGPELLEHWDRAIGRLAEPFPAHQSLPPLVAKWSAEYPTARRDVIEAALEHLGGRIAASLKESGRGAMQLECRLECSTGDPVQVSVGLFQPTVGAKHLIELLLVRFEQIRLTSPVVAIHLSATMTAPLELRQQDLFEGLSRQRPGDLARLIDRLSNRLGRSMVMRSRLVPDAQPEYACHYVPMVSVSGRRTPPRAARRALPSRPTRLLAQPLPLKSGITSSFFFAGQRHDIARTWGPERIETGWWRGFAIGRDYYRIETTTGRRFWVFHRLRDDRWFLHGVFD
jgi:protein ImuB